MALLQHVINTIKISQLNNHFSCNVPNSKFIFLFLKSLTLNGLISGFTTSNSQNIVFLRYNKQGNGLLSKFSVCSTPGKKLLKSYNILREFTKYSNGFIVSSTSGIIINFKGNTSKNLISRSGGELICKF